MDLLTPEEVADALQVAEQTLTNWRHKGGGPPFVKVGRNVRYRRQALEDWLDGREFDRTHEPTT